MRGWGHPVLKLFKSAVQWCSRYVRDEEARRAWDLADTDPHAALRSISRQLHEAEEYEPSAAVLAAADELERRNELEKLRGEALHRRAQRAEGALARLKEAVYWERNSKSYNIIQWLFERNRKPSMYTRLDLPVVHRKCAHQWYGGAALRTRTRESRPHLRSIYNCSLPYSRKCAEVQDAAAAHT